MHEWHVRLRASPTRRHRDAPRHPSTCTTRARCGRSRTRCACASSACCASTGPQSVGALAEATGAASGSVSYHLVTLAKHGFVVPAPELERDGRERWWRAAHEMTSWRSRGVPRRPRAPRGVRGHAPHGARLRTTASCSTRSTPRSASSPSGSRHPTRATARAHSPSTSSASSTAELDGGAREVVGRAAASPRDGTRPVRWITHTFPRSDHDRHRPMTRDADHVADPPHPAPPPPAHREPRPRSSSRSAATRSRSSRSRSSP